MLRVEYHDIGETVTMRLEGRFVLEFAKDARTRVSRCRTPLRLIVNLSEVTFVDLTGEEVLLWLGRIGGGCC
jgi:anti-anti-sigma regulatory factor